MISKYLENLKNDNLSLYIHIPFCKKKCSYCGFYSEVCNDYAIIKSVVREIKRDINKILQIRKAPFTTVYIGGGNPGILNIDDLDELLHTCFLYGRPIEISIEINPESITLQFLELCKKYKITRISTGLQSLHTDLLKTIGRNADIKAINDAINILKNRSKSIALNTDIITCIPNQKQTDTIQDLEYIIRELQPEHISLYALTIDENTLLEKMLHEGKLKILDNETSAEILSQSWNYLKNNGYRHYEVSNFSKNTNQSNMCLHNYQYWHQQSYIAVGPGGVSTLYAKDNTALRIQNTHNINSYISGTKEENFSLEFLKEKELLFEAIMLGLRLDTGVSDEKQLKVYETSCEKVFPKTLKNLKKRDLLKDCNEGCILNEQGVMLLDSILIDILVEIDHHTI